MAPKLSAKKATEKAPSSETASVKKFKMPKLFIVRPHVNPLAKTMANVYLNQETFDAMEFKNGQFACISPMNGKPGIIALVKASSDAAVADNVLLLSENFRKLGGFLLGERVNITRNDRQPSYASEVVVNGVDLCKEVLGDVGLIYPGLRINTADKEVTIIDVASSIESELGSLSLNSTSPPPTVSPPYLMTSQTTLINTSESKPSATKYPYLPQDLAYSDIGGLQKQIDVLQSTVELPLHNPSLFTDFGIAPPRGVLLHGPPGTGKSMLLRCVAQNVNAHVLTVSGPSIVSKYLGETENALRSIFEEASKYQPALIIMDEVDSLVPSRDSDDSGGTENRVVATLLTMMDGLSYNSQVVIVGATNRPNSIDIALRRPGRFDQEIEVGIPDADSRRDILQKQLDRMNLAKFNLTAEDITEMAAKTHGYVGADLSALCREAVMKAISRGLALSLPHNEIKVTMQDVYDALAEIRPSAMREIFLETPQVRWSDIGGQHELKRKLKEVVQLPLEAASSFANLGVKSPKGVLLYGPPGCSKTLAAKALATESGLNFLAIKGPEIFNKYVGESERAIREMFRKARAAAPSIIFLDEIDAIAGDRDQDGTSASKNVLTSLLNEIDGVEELKGVVIVGATNKPSEIDPALLRPGRLDRHIYVAPPDLEARLQILKNCSRRFNLGDDVDLNKYAELTSGCSGAEVTLLCQEAGLNAIMESRDANRVENRHFENALKGISRNISPEMLDYYRAFSRKSGISI